MKGIWVLAVVLAFVAGSILTGTMASAQKDGVGDNLIVTALNNIADAINGITPTQTVTVQSLEGPEGPEGPEGEQGPEGETGPAGPSIGGSDVILRKVTPCRFTDGTDLRASSGAVLLSDGTVKVPSPTGGYTTPHPLFGSLPAGVWHDIEVKQYTLNFRPEGCFFPGPNSNLPPEPVTDNEILRACAVADTGDVYCVDGQVNRDTQVLTGIPWTFQGDAIP